VRPERTAALVARWVRLYTRNLATDVKERRSAELEADLHDQIAHERAVGIDDRTIARGIASRMLRGVVADLLWRARQPKRPTVTRSAARVAIGVALVLSVPLAATALGAAVWSLADFVLAGVLLAVVGTALELAARRSGSLVTAAGIGTLGIAAALLGESDDAPGLVLLGILLVGSGCTLALRRVQKRS
jgi:hypothetical protein